MERRQSTVLKRAGFQIIVVLMLLFSIAFMIVPYAISVDNGHVYAFFPYISDTGNFSPERSWFSLLLNLTGFLAIWICYFRHHSIQSNNKNDTKNVLRLNNFSLACAAMAIFGTVMVAAFQETQLGSLHGAGAIITFGFGGLYMLLSSIISFRLERHARITKLRWLYTILMALSIIIFIIAGSKANSAKPLIPPDNCTVVSESTGLKNSDGTIFGGYWQPCLPGWPFRVTASVSEWVMGVSLILFFSSYYSEFKEYRFAIHITQIESSTVRYGDSVIPIGTGVVLSEHWVGPMPDVKEDTSNNYQQDSF